VFQAPCPVSQPTERLQKVIARSGLCSRRVAEEMIAAGRVSVDGATAHLGQKIEPSTARVEVDGIPLPVAPDLVYRLLNKPAGVVTTTSDPQGRSTVVDLVPAEPRVFPVGRLDVETTGLLVLTNDGVFTNLVTHPRFGITKTYEALVTGRPSRSTLRKLVEGIELEDGPASAMAARLIDSASGSSHLEIVMGEGRNREVRRLCETAGHPVVRLHRAAIGPLHDQSLAEGTWRPLTIEEVRSVFAAAREDGPIDEERPE